MYFVLGGLSLGREHLWAPRLITYGRGAVTCTTGWSRQTQHSSLSKSVVWTRLGYFLTNCTILHSRVNVRCIHHTEHVCKDVTFILYVFGLGMLSVLDLVLLSTLSGNQTWEHKCIDLKVSYKQLFQYCVIDYQV